MPSSPAFKNQPDDGQISGFDFYRDPLNAKKPMMTFREAMEADIAAKPGVMESQRQLLRRRYNLDPRLDPEVKMSRGKPVPVGPTAKLLEGMNWDGLAQMRPEEIRTKANFPYPSLPHPKQSPGGQVFPQMQSEMFPRLERFDVDHDLPEAFLPEFPPAIFLNNRPELGDVSRGEVVSINNYYRLFKDLLTPVQLDGLRMLLTPFPQSVEDFTEFEFRTAYFNGDPIHAMKKGFTIIPRVQVAHMAQMQNMFDFPPAPKLNSLGRLDPAKATESERRGEELFFGKAQCATCHPAPSYLDHQMHDLHLERFLNEPGDGPMKTFTLRGITDSPPYLHDGRCLTLEDTVEFFNLVQELQLSQEEKKDLVAFMRQL